MWPNNQPTDRLLLEAALRLVDQRAQRRAAHLPRDHLALGARHRRLQLICLSN